MHQRLDSFQRITGLSQELALGEVFLRIKVIAVSLTECRKQRSECRMMQ